MTDPERRDRTCQGCGRSIMDMADGGETGAEEGLYCPQCLIARAERYIREPEIAPEPLKRLRETTAWKIFLILALLICMAVIAYQAPRIMAAFQPPKPVRMGTYATDATTDQCLKNLWRLAAELQQGRNATAPALVCPAGGKPYVIVPGPDPEVHCPAPSAHGFRDIVVSRNKPVPELKK